MSKQGKWASILIMEPPSVPAWARASKHQIHNPLEKRSGSQMIQFSFYEYLWKSILYQNILSLFLIPAQHEEEGGE